MAQFNPENPSDSPSFLHYSRGVKSMDWNSILSSAGQAVSGLFTAIDNSNQSGIKQQIYKTSDQNDDATAAGVQQNMNPVPQVGATTAPNTPASPSSVIPAPLMQMTQTMATLHNGGVSGVLPSTYSALQFESMAKTLRAQYPGYRDFIDGQIKSITGMDPANHLRSTLDQQVQANQTSAAAEQNKLNELKKLGAENGIVFSPDDKQANDFTYVQSHVLQAVAGKAKLAQQSAALDLKIKQGTATADDANALAMQKTDNFNDTLLKQSVMVAGKGASGQNLMDMATKALADGVVTPEEEKAILPYTMALRAQGEAGINAILADPALNSTMKISDKQNVRKYALDRLDGMMDMITNKQYGLLVFNQNMLDTISKGDEIAGMNASSVLRTVNMLNKTMGPQAVAAWLQAGNGQNQTDFNTAVSNWTAAQSITGQGGVPEAIQTIKSSVKDPKDQGPAVLTYLQKTVNTLNNPAFADPVVFSKAVKATYTEAQTAFATSPPATQLKVFSTLITPDLTKKIIASGDVDARNAYLQFADKAYLAFTKPHMDELKTQIDKGQATLAYDPASGQFKVTPISKGTKTTQLFDNVTGEQRGSITDPTEGGLTLSNTQAKASTDALNQYMNTMRPVMTAAGEKPDALATAAMQAAGIDPNSVMPQTDGKPATRGITPKVEGKLPDDAHKDASDGKGIPMDPSQRGMPITAKNAELIKGDIAANPDRRDAILSNLSSQGYDVSTLDNPVKDVAPKASVTPVQLPASSGDAVWKKMVGDGGGAEARGDPGAVSPKGAMGLAQLMPGTARTVAKGMGITLPDDMPAYFKTPEGQKVNLQIGKEYYKQQLETFHGDAIAAAVAYNAGPGVAKKWIASGKDDSVLPKETRDYIQKVSGPGSEASGSVYPKYSGDADKFLLPRMSHPDQLAGLQPYFKNRLAAMFSAPDAPPGLGLFSGYRDQSPGGLQDRLHQAAVKKYGSEAAASHWVAAPGHSVHGSGEAGDISYNGESLAHAPPSVIQWVHQHASQYGMYFPMSWESWHIQPIGTHGGHTHTGGAAGGGTEPPRVGFERGSNAPDISDSQSASSLEALSNPTFSTPAITPAPVTERNGYVPPVSNVDSSDPVAATDGVAQAYGITDPSVKALIQRMIEAQFPQGINTKDPEHIHKLMAIVLKAQKMKKK